MRFTHLHTSVRTKLTILMMVIAFLVLLISTSYLLYSDISWRYKERKIDLQNISKIIAFGSEAALSFHDASAAQENLESLKFKSHVLAAMLLQNDGTVLAKYLKRNNEYHSHAEDITAFFKPRQSQEVLSSDHTLQIERIYSGEQLVGELRILSGDDDIRAAIASNIRMAFWILVICLFIAYLLAQQFQKIITKPLNTIITTSKKIAHEKNYSERIEYHRFDEFREVIDQLNSMLGEIEERDNNLEEAVHERTKELKLQAELLEKERDQAQAATKAKGEFLANMSHEIRTPMNGVIGMAELLEETSLDATQKELVSTVLSSAETLLNIINDVLDFSKIEAGKLTLDKRIFSLRESMSHIEAMFSNRARSKNISFSFTYDQDLPEWLLGDILRLQQILINLISNAIKFTNPGGGVITHTYKESEENGIAWISFIVIDSGIEMTREDSEKVFESFAQADTTATRKYGGTGLGLSISQQLVSLMGGAIEVRSKIGIGSAFRIQLPFLLGDEPEEKDKESNCHVPEIALSDTCVLLVEDNEINQKLAQKLLQKKGYRVEIANNGLEAVQKSMEQTFDLILMDIQMPVMDGVEACDKIRNLTNSNARVPIVALTAHAMKGDQERYLRAGMNQYISKPINRKIFYDTIESLLDEEGEILS